MRTAFFHDERCLWHSTQGLFSLVLPVGAWVQPPASAGLAESPESKRRAVSLMQVSGLAERVDLRSAEPATDEDLERVHPADYLARFAEMSAAGGGELGEFAPFGPGSFDIARVSAGLAIAAVDTVLDGTYQNAYSLSRPPGHHCSPTQPMGFCLLNNIAIAIEAAKHRHGLGRVVVLDWDVHHGNGTQACFYDRDDVMTISMHQEGCFPPGYSGVEDRGSGAGEGFNINVPLLPGGGHEAYMQAMQTIVIPAIDRYAPELIVVASGFDSNGFDPLARMLLHSESYRTMTGQVMQLAAKHCEDRLVVVHEGGYAESYVPFCVHAVVEQMSGERTDAADPMLEFFEAQQPNARVTALQAEMISEMASAFGLA